jgi:hypothetical protein
VIICQELQLGFIHIPFAFAGRMKAPDCVIDVGLT